MATAETIAGEPTRWERGRLVTDWRLEPWPVYGGWTVRRVRWVRSDDGWWQDDEPVDRPERIVAGRAEAERLAGAAQETG